MQTTRTGTTSFFRLATTLTVMVVAACGGDASPAAPTPPTVATANVYILPGALALGRNAFGDEDIVIYKGERMRLRNLDGAEHTVVADTSALPEFASTGPLAPGDERSFIMNTVGTTGIHCADDPRISGVLVVRER